MECPLFIRLPSDIILNINRIDGIQSCGNGWFDVFSGGSDNPFKINNDDREVLFTALQPLMNGGDCSPSVTESIHIGEEMMSVEKMREKAHDSVEPKNRVLTFDEVATFADLPEMTLMWVEVKFTNESDIFQEIPIGFNGELMQFLEVNSASLYTHKQNYPPEDYGSRWRCWLEKPTVKEMEMALWEE